jgi:Uma2 family endonuclease
MSVISMTTPDVVNDPPPYADGERYEIVDDKRVEMMPMSLYAAWIASQLSAFLFFWNHDKKAGHIVSEAPFRLPLPKVRERQPDVAFVSYQRWPQSRPLHRTARAWSVAPDLVVEVVSPNDKAEELQEKLTEYFQAGVRLVWVIYPVLSQVIAFESLRKMRGLLREDDLDGGDVLPGFVLPLSKLFPEETAPATPSV